MRSERNFIVHDEYEYDRERDNIHNFRGFIRILKTANLIANDLYLCSS